MEHIIDVELCAAVDRTTAAGSHGQAQYRCAVCNDPSQWVVVGQCGHRAVCPKCMVRLRFFHRDKHCYTCKARCSKVVVTRTNGGATALPALPSPYFRDGKVGKYWYHRHTAAYFEDEQEYQAARAACKGILSPFYEPIFCFLPCILVSVAFGAALGGSILYEMKTNQRSKQIIVYAVSVCAAMSVGGFFWHLIKRTEDPLVMEAILAEAH